MHDYSVGNWTLISSTIGTMNRVSGLNLRDIERSVFFQLVFRVFCGQKVVSYHNEKLFVPLFELSWLLASSLPNLVGLTSGFPNTRAKVSYVSEDICGSVPLRFDLIISKFLLWVISPIFLHFPCSKQGFDSSTVVSIFGGSFLIIWGALSWEESACFNDLGEEHSVVASKSVSIIAKKRCNSCREGKATFHLHSQGFKTPV